MVLEYLLTPAGVAGIVGALYLIRKYREYTWGWVRNKYSLKDKIYIITGANSGLGFQTARALAKRGATVVICCRSMDRANQAIEKIQAETSEGRLVALQLDLGSFASIRECASQIKTHFPQFDCLINNAGVSVKSKQFTKENYEVHFGVNHLGHFLLFKLLEDNIRQNNSRIVVVSSLLHQEGVIDFEKLGKCDDSRQSKYVNPLYSDSKLMNFYFARELYKKGFDVHILCPGFCYTDLVTNHTFKWYQLAAMSPVIFFIMRSAEQGAQNIIHAATDNKKDEKKNPFTGYLINNLEMTKSKHNFQEEIGERLWEESLKMCELK
ncbi:unnamed protein product [Hermetia illucens]|uniref:Uncharacterized protein n=1 Tax=Hermetia illucens TaxID=343691 RepID=A0A7R8YSR4_HERIL|nr:retinol dehydrogenase 13-like [Hermetia illucens]CAD7084127.1 unnamed protein product [Hermetia illucens]